MHTVSFELRSCGERQDATATTTVGEKENGRRESLVCITELKNIQHYLHMNGRYVSVKVVNKRIQTRAAHAGKRERAKCLSCGILFVYISRPLGRRHTHAHTQTHRSYDAQCVCVCVDRELVCNYFGWNVHSHSRQQRRTANGRPSAARRRSFLSKLLHITLSYIIDSVRDAVPHMRVRVCVPFMKCCTHNNERALEMKTKFVHANPPVSPSQLYLRCQRS